MELNAEQIKRALECCVTTSAGDCKNCGYRGKSHDNFITCTNCLIADALSLINSQEQKIKELTKDVDFGNRRYNMLIGRQREIVTEKRGLIAENERLRAENEMLLNIKNLNLDKVIADTVRKMQGALCEDRVSNDPVVIAVNVVAKEMLEGEK